MSRFVLPPLFLLCGENCVFRASPLFYKCDPESSSTHRASNVYQQILECEDLLVWYVTSVCMYLL